MSQKLKSITIDGQRFEIGGEATGPAEWTEITIEDEEAVFPQITDNTQLKLVLVNTDGGGRQEIYFYGSLFTQSVLTEGARFNVYDHDSGSVTSVPIYFNNSTKEINFGVFISTLTYIEISLFYR